MASGFLLNEEWGWGCLRDCERHWKKKLASHCINTQGEDMNWSCFQPHYKVLLLLVVVVYVFMCSGSRHSYWLSLQWTLSIVTECYFFGHSQRSGLSEVFWQTDRKCWHQKIPTSVDIDDLTWATKEKNDSGGSGKATARERKAQWSIPSIFSSAAGCPLRISWAGTASAAVAWCTFGDTSHFTVHGSSIPCVPPVEISGEIAWQPLSLGEMNRHTGKP